MIGTNRTRYAAVSTVCRPRRRLETQTHLELVATQRIEAFDFHVGVANVL